MENSFHGHCIRDCSLRGSNGPKPPTTRLKEKSEMVLKLPFETSALRISVRYMDNLVWGKCSCVENTSSRQKRPVLLDAIDKYLRMTNRRGGSHPDRLCAMFYLAHRYRLQQRLDEAINLCHEIITKFDSINGRERPWFEHLG